MMPSHNLKDKKLDTGDNSGDDTDYDPEDHLKQLDPKVLDIHLNSSALGGESSLNVKADQEVVITEEINKRSADESGYNQNKYFKKKKLATHVKVKQEPVKVEPCFYIKKEEDNFGNFPTKYFNGKSVLFDETTVQVKLEVKEEPLEQTIMSSGNCETGVGQELNDFQETVSHFSPRDLDLLKKLEEIRHWEKTGLGLAFETGQRYQNNSDLGFRLMSYNILGQSNLENHSHLYRNMSQHILDWDYRWIGISRELLTHNPDIVTLQEVQFSGPDMYSSCIGPWFDKHGYEGVRKCKTGDKTEGCAIFFKKDKFSLISSKVVEYKVEDVGVLDRDNIGLICCLMGSNKSKLNVATTHLLFNPKRLEVRLAQTAVMLAELDSVSWSQASKSYTPTILCGDFNFQPYSDCYNLLKTGIFEYEGIPCGRSLLPKQLFPLTFNFSDSCQWVEELYKRGKIPQFGSGRFYHQFGFRSTHKHSRHYDERVPVGGYETTTFHGSWVTVDYIFYSTDENVVGSRDGRKEGNLKLISRLSLPTGPEISALGGLPSVICPSDHLPLVADFLLQY